MSGKRCPKCHFLLADKSLYNCPQCHYRFVFHHNPNMSDWEWESLLEDASGKHNLAFALESLATIKASRPVAKPNPPLMSLIWFSLAILVNVALIPIDSWLIASLILATVSVVMILIEKWKSFPKPRGTPLNMTFCVAMGLWLGFNTIHLTATLLSIMGAITLIPFALRHYRSPPKPLGIKKVMALHQKWRRYHHYPQLMSGVQQLTIKPNRFPEKDLYDHGFDEVLVVDDPLLVDLLINNGFHVTSGIPIFSSTGYPKHLQKPLKVFIKQNPRAKHYFIHGTSSSAESMKEQLNEWGYDPTDIFDLGWSTIGAMGIPLFDSFVINDEKPLPLTALPPKTMEKAILTAIAEKSQLADVCQRVDINFQFKAPIAEVEEIE